MYLSFFINLFFHLLKKHLWWGLFFFKRKNLRSGDSPVSLKSRRNNWDLIYENFPLYWNFYQKFHTTFPLMPFNLNSLFSHLNYKLVPLQLLFPTETSQPLSRGLLPGVDPCRSGSASSACSQPLWSGFLSPQRNQHTQRLRPLKENSSCWFKPWELIYISNNELAVQSQYKHT